MKKTYFSKIFIFSLIILGLNITIKLSKANTLLNQQQVNQNNSQLTILSETIPIAYKEEKNKQFEQDTRGRCQGNSPQEAFFLIPSGNADGLSISKYPSFWAYIPDKSEFLKEIEFEIQNSDGKKFAFRATYEIEKSPGFIAINLSEIFKSEIFKKTTFELKEEESYRAQLTIICNQEEPADSYNSYGSFVLKSKNKYPGKQNNFNYLKNEGIWYDAVNKVLISLLNDPENFREKENFLSLIDEQASSSLKDLIKEELKFGQLKQINLVRGDLILSKIRLLPISN